MIGLDEQLLLVAAAPDPYGGMSIDNIGDLIMLRDLVNTGTCIWNGVSTNTYKGNAFTNQGFGMTWYVTNDIDMSSVCSPSLGSWTPIGYISSKYFGGTIQGLDHSINNLYINNSGGQKGLFGYVRDFGLYNLNILDAYVSATQQSGIIFGAISGSGTGHSIVMEGCTISGQLIVTDTIAAGFFTGSIATYYSYFQIKDCINYASITSTATSSNVAGIFRTSSGHSLTNTDHIVNCHNYGVLSGSNVSGIISVGSSAVRYKCVDCTNHTDLNASYTYGIGVGANLHLDSCINNGHLTGGNCCGIGQAQIYDGCVNNGNVTATSNASGFYRQYSSYDCTLTNCINNGNITVTGTSSMYCAGFFSYLASGSGKTITFLNCTNNGIITINGTSGTAGGIIAYYMASAYMIYMTNVYNFGDIVSNVTNASGSYAGTLIAYLNTSISNYYNPIYLENCHAECDINAPLGSVVLLAHLFIAKECSITNCSFKGAVTSSSTSLQAFNGVGLNPLTNSSIDVTITNPGASTITCQGFGSGVQNATNCNSVITIVSGSVIVYGIGGMNNASAICESCTSEINGQVYQCFGIGTGNATAQFIDCHTTGNVGMNGGNPKFTGIAISGIISGCTNSINATGTGTMAGIASDVATVTNCINYGNLETTNSSAAGIHIGVREATISNCINNGDITAKVYASGIAHCSSTYAIAVDHCINYGTISGVSTTTVYIGGICATISSTASTINNCLNAGNVVSNTTGTAMIGGILGQCGGSTIGPTLSTCLFTGSIINISGTLMAGSILGVTSNANLVVSYNYYDLLISSYAGINNVDYISQAEGFSTTALQGNALENIGGEWTTDNWIFETGEYPTPKMS